MRSENTEKDIENEFGRAYQYRQVGSCKMAIVFFFGGFLAWAALIH